MNNVPITDGQGQSSVAAEQIGTIKYQQIKVVGGEVGSSSVMGVNPDRSINVSVIGVPTITLSGSPSISGAVTVIGRPSISGTVNVASLIAIPNIISAVNSSTSTLGGGAVFTGTSEDIKDFAAVVINVFSDQASATNGLSIQQSSDGSNWDITDTYSIAAATGKTFSVQPAARFFRIVYTNGATPQTAFRLQTIYHITTPKPSSQRTQDNYTNETDLEQVWSFNSLWDGATWDRTPGNTESGALVQTGTASVFSLQKGTWSSSVVTGNASVITVFQSSSILAVPVGSVITAWQNPSIVGTYGEDSPHTSADKGLFALHVRNDTLSSITSADLDYSPLAVGPVGEAIMANSPITKWVRGTADLRVVLGSSVTAIAAQGASIFTYITGVQIANMGSASVLVTLAGGLGSILGYSIAPAGGGSNIYYPNALKTGENSAFTASISGTASVLVSAQGFIAKI